MVHDGGAGAKADKMDFNVLLGRGPCTVPLADISDDSQGGYKGHRGVPGCGGQSLRFRRGREFKRVLFLTDFQ